jgi:hypothetical protein
MRFSLQELLIPPRAEGSRINTEQPVLLCGRNIYSVEKVHAQRRSICARNLDESLIYPCLCDIVLHDGMKIRCIPRKCNCTEISIRLTSSLSDSNK